MPLLLTVALTTGCATHPMTDALPSAQPEVVASFPELHATNVYPAPVGLNGEQFVVRFEFSQPMQLNGDVILTGPDHELTVALVSWAREDTSLELVFLPGFTMPHPLADDTPYFVDTSALVSRHGASLRPDRNLSQGKLLFRTGYHDPLLNHSCGHTLFGPFASLSAAPNPGPSAPDISTTHTQYMVNLLPLGPAGTTGGWVRARFPTDGPYRLYFDQPALVQLANSEGTLQERLSASIAPAACPGITHELQLQPKRGEDLFLLLGPQPRTELRIIVELVPTP